MEILKGKYTTEENALIVDNYPYGFKRTKAKYWIESNKKGDRLGFNTLNPKTDKWNTAKYGTYAELMVLYIEEGTKHIKNLSLNSYGDLEDYLIKVGDYEFNAYQLERIKVLKAYKKVYANVSFNCVDATSWTKEEREAHDKEQQDKQAIINRAVAREYLKGD